MGSWRKGWHVIVHSLNVFKAYPSFLLPILGVWIIYATGILYVQYGYQWRHHATGDDVAIAVVFVFSLSFLILMSCSVTLEMIRQIEAGKPSLTRAIGKAVGKDMLKVLPLSVVWTIIWLVLTTIEMMLSKGKDKQGGGDEALTAQNAAVTIANFRDFSFSEAFFEALQKGVRMVMFLIMPAIAWENLGFGNATKKGLAVLRAHLGLFGRGYALTYAAAAIIFLPAVIVLELGTRHHGNPPLMHFPDYVWVATIIYMGFAWSLSIYLEQMFMAQIYLWHMAWEKEVAVAESGGAPPPEFKAVGRPELLDKTPGLFA